MKKLAAVALALASSSCAVSSGWFEYEFPKFGADLHRANFEYVKFGAVAEVSIPEKTQAMIQNMEIGLVNDALKKIYSQAKVQGEAVALVNVVMDVSKRIVVESGLTSTNTSTFDDYLVIRADIVRFTSGAATPTASEGVYDQSEASVAALAEMVAKELSERGHGASD